ncbi:craniofacial development protein 2-like [Limulus polyphemus]|uniref:Craniofacial development protein 2-like n=1 Tax=Limulus polyphemus TaxID=6850 RepID=A0ABM1BZZ0_LIMPO|nr:craniofacial development protein 2-like [Limulus polyphemus]
MQPTPPIRPRSSLNIGAFNVRTLKQMGQQAALARTLDSLAIAVCCICETRLYDSSTVVELTAPSLTQRYYLHCSGDPTAEAVGQTGVGVVLNSRAEATLLDWIPISSCLCTIRLKTEIGISSKCSTKRCLFVVAAYAPTNGSCDSAKDTFYAELSTLLRRAKNSDVVIFSGDMNAQLDRLGLSETQFGGRYGLEGQRTDNSERLLHLCSEHRLFLSSTAFRHKKSQCTTW